MENMNINHNDTQGRDLKIVQRVRVFINVQGLCIAMHFTSN